MTMAMTSAFATISLAPAEWAFAEGELPLAASLGRVIGRGEEGWRTPAGRPAKRDFPSLLG